MDADVSTATPPRHRVVWAVACVKVPNEGRLPQMRGPQIMVTIERGGLLPLGVADADIVRLLGKGAIEVVP